MAKKNKKFWMIVNLTAGSSFHIKHDTYESAETEAKRLANKHPESEFIILESVGGYVVKLTEPKPIGY